MKTQQLKAITNILKNNKKALSGRFGVLSIAVFGSVARGEGTKASDIDIIVELREKSKTFDNYMELKFYLEKLLRKRTDLVIKESIRKELKPRILKEAVYA